MTAQAKQLFEVSIEQVRRGQVRQALATLLDVLGEDPAHEGALAAAARICRVLGASADAERFEALIGPKVEAEALYEMGYHLTEQGRPDVACSYLRQALEQAPDDEAKAAVQRELAFALLQSRDFGACLTTLSEAARSPDLAEAERLDIDLMSAEAALYLGRIEVARRFLDQADDRVPTEDQLARLDALHALMGRATRWTDGLARAGLREWHHIQHAGVLLKVAGGWFEDGSFGGRFELLDLKPDMIAFLLMRLSHLLERLDVRPEVVVPASDLSRPLALALASRLDAEVVDELSDRGERPALLLAASAGELEPYTAGLAQHRSDLQVAALALDWSRDAPVSPDVVGVLARRAFLPWEKRFSVDPQGGQGRTEPGDARPARAVAADLVTAMEALPDDGGKARGEFESFYLPLRDELVLGNADRYPLRRQFVHVSPAWTPTGKRPDSARMLHELD